jgi:hypothetical protein
MKPVIMLLCFAFCISAYAQQKDSKFSLNPKDSIAKTLQPVTGKAIVYIIRPSVFGSAIRMGIKYDDTLMGHTYSRQYVYTILDSGMHTFSSRAESKIELQLNLNPGKIYFIKQQVQPGLLFAETRLVQLSEEEGRKYLKKCILSKDNIYSNDNKTN